MLILMFHCFIPLSPPKIGDFSGDLISGKQCMHAPFPSFKRFSNCIEVETKGFEANRVFLPSPESLILCGFEPFFEKRV